uniref:TLC domain-containing protein n=1 Tax=Panagrellus redivivus TaxID=6233 RepID=A0A7E4VYL3_PANRE
MVPEGLVPIGFYFFRLVRLVYRSICQVVPHFLSKAIPTWPISLRRRVFIVDRLTYCHGYDLESLLAYTLSLLTNLVCFMAISSGQRVEAPPAPRRPDKRLTWAADGSTSAMAYLWSGGLHTLICMVLNR